MATSFGITPRPGGYLVEPREPRYCEPYVLVTRIHLHSSRPDVQAFLYGPWGRATADVIPLVRRESFWELDVLAAPTAKPDLIFLVALMEHLGGSPGAVRSLVEKAIIEELAVSAGMAQETRMTRLIGTTDRVVDSANGGPNVTSTIGLRLRAEDVRHPNRDGACPFVLSFSGYGGHYGLHLKSSKSEPDLLVPRDDAAFARAAE